jgi:hypothetical protein
MTNDEWRKANHQYIEQFLNQTQDDKSDITGTVKATIAQFLVNVKRQFNLIAEEKKGILTREDLIQTQIDQLRVCVIDLQRVLTTKEGKQ